VGEGPHRVPVYGRHFLAALDFMARSEVGLVESVGRGYNGLFPRALCVRHPRAKTCALWARTNRGAFMKINRRMVFASIPLSLLFASSLQAAPKSSWDGTWSGSWGGRDPTSITIAGKRVVSYEYQGVSTPVARSKVTPKRVTYTSNGTTVTLTKTSKTTAFATLHSSQGDATAELTKQ